jgi:hypothetical protein
LLFRAQYDLRHSRHWEFKAQLDILLLPSKLAMLAKVAVTDMTVFKESDLRSSLVSGTMHANSGQSIKADSGSNEVMLGNKVFSRTAVKIVKI